MRRLYSLTLICVAFLLLLAPPSAAQLSASHQETFTVARPGTRITSGPKAVYHQIAWNTSGGPGACFLSLDYSTDGMVWNLAGTIPGHDCTQSGETIIAGPQPVQFVRVNVNALSNGAAIRTTYSGYQTNPGGPTGSVTSVFGRTGAIQATAGDYSVALITGAAPIFSPNFQGSPTAPTPSPGDSSNLVATTGFVAQALAGCCGGGGGQGAGVTTFAGRSGAVVPEASDYAAFFAPIGGGGGGAVTSVFGRTGAVVGQASDYAGIFAPLASPTFTGTPSAVTAPLGTNTTQLATTEFVIANRGGGTSGGLSGTGSPNFIPRFTTSTALGNSALTDDGTSLLYTGTGGIIAPKLTITQGAYLLESTQAPLPATPGVNHNGLVSGPDGFYVSNNNSAWFKIEPPGAGGTGGAVASVFGRTGAVTAATGDYNFSQISGTLTSGQIGTAAVASFNTRGGAVLPAAGDYTVAQVTGAAPLSSPSLTGTPTSTTPPLGDSSFRIATTQWVKAQGYGTGGGGGGLPVSHSQLTPTCVARNSGTGAIIINEPVSEGDTVLVGISMYNTTPVTSGVTVTDGASTYTQLTTRATASNSTMFVFSTTAGGGHAASTITVNWAVNNKMMACAMAYQNVASIGTPATFTATTAVSSITVSATTTAANSVVFGFIGTLAITTFTELSGTMLAEGATTVGTGQSAVMCEVVVPTAGSASCGVNLSVVAQHNSMAVELKPAPSTGGGTGAVSSVFNRIGAVAAQSGDYTVQQVTGAAPIESPSFQGVPAAPTAPLGSSSNQLATTAFVAQAIAAETGGGGAAVPIVTGSTLCEAKDATTNSTQTISGLTINPADTVIVSFTVPTGVIASTGPTITDNGSGGSNTYSYHFGRWGTNNIAVLIFTTAASGVTHAATSVTVNTSYTGRSQMCVTTYKGVAAFGGQGNNATLNSNTVSVNANPQDNTGVVYCAAGINLSVTFTASTGQMLGQAPSSTAGSRSTVGVLEQRTVDPTVMQCAVTASDTANVVMAGIELRPGAGGGGGGTTPPATSFPKVVAQQTTAVVPTTNTLTDVQMLACPIANCPAAGFYRVSWDFLGVTSCTTGTAVAQVSVDYVDAASTSNIHHTGMMTSPGTNITNANHAYGYRLMTTNAALPAAVPPQAWPAGTGINFTYSIPTGCTSGNGLGQLVLTVERLY